MINAAITELTFNKYVHLLQDAVMQSAMVSQKAT